ncbi:MAG TPA: MFS transporter [Aestuariivirgaceae bacterium]|nr:MFS transporter [Aestuariivirgaceae bacterium]
MNLIKTRNDRDVLLSTSIASSMVFIDTTAVNTVLPAIQRSLDTALTDAQWVVEIYMLFLASLLLLGGALGDRFGRRRVFRLGIILFAFASLACGLSETPLQLIAARAFQGIAAALLTPASLALLNASFPPERRAAAVGAWSAVTALAVPLGPVLGGALADWLSWHWIFFINLPLSIAALYALRNVERPRFDPQIASSFDLAGAVVITLALGGLVYGLLELSRRGLSDDFVLAGFVVSAIGLPLFVLIESRAKNPLMPLSLFKIRTFTGINLATFLLYGGLYASSFFIPFKFISTQGYSAAQAGAALLPLPLAISILSRASGAIAHRLGLVTPVVAGSILTGCGLIGIGLTPLGHSYWTGYLPFITVLAIGLGLLVAPLTTIAVNAAGEGKSGIASSLNNAVVDVGALFTIAIAGLLLVPIYRRQLIAGLAALLPPDAVTAIAAQASKLANITLPPGFSADLNDAAAISVKAALAESLGMVIAFGGIGGFIAAAVTALLVRPRTVAPQS